MKTILNGNTQKKSEARPAPIVMNRPCCAIHSIQGGLWQLQKAVGNKEIQRLYKTGKLQAFLRIGQPNDVYEQEAERVADHVLRMPKRSIQKCAGCKDEETSVIRKKTALSVNSISSVPNDLVTSLGSGQSLDRSTRDYFEPRFGMDFSHVRVHAGVQAKEASQSISALAFTLGNNIVFNNGQYSPETEKGKRLLAHELVHIIQQSNPNDVYRKKLTEEDKKEDLRSDRLKNDFRLQKAFDQSPSMRWGEHSEGVKTLQRALNDLGYKLPVSFAKNGDADGVFGNETRDTVKQFQRDNGLDDDDGVAGRDTLRALDAKFLAPSLQNRCHINYAAGTLDRKGKDDFLKKNFSATDRPQSGKILEDLCSVQTDQLNFSHETELRNEIMKRLRVSHYMQKSQLEGAFAYPEHAKENKCIGATGNALADAKVNQAAQDYWLGPYLESRPGMEGRHYYFQLNDRGKADAYNAIKLLFTPQTNICKRTLIHCDSLITLVQTLSYADTIGKEVFNNRVKGGTLFVWLTYDGMSAIPGDKKPTPTSESVRYVLPSSENDLVIGDHVVFWNHLGYDAITVKNPGPWRLENALLVDKNAAGEDLFEGHGAVTRPKDLMLEELKNVFNTHVNNAKAITDKVDAGDVTAYADLNNRFPQVKKLGDNKWYILEIKDNAHRNRKEKYEFKKIDTVKDPELIGLRNPDDPAKLNWVKRPVESQ